MLLTLGLHFSQLSLRLMRLGKEQPQAHATGGREGAEPLEHFPVPKTNTQLPAQAPRSAPGIFQPNTKDLSVILRKTLLHSEEVCVLVHIPCGSSLTYPTLEFYN